MTLLTNAPSLPTEGQTYSSPITHEWHQQRSIKGKLKLQLSN